MAKRKKWKRRSIAGAVIMLALLSNCITMQAYGLETESQTGALSVWYVWDAPESELEKRVELPEAVEEKATEWKKKMNAADAVNESEDALGGTQSMQKTALPPIDSSDDQTVVMIDSVSTSAAKKQTGSSEYIFPDSDIRYLSQEEVETLSSQAVCYARNEIFARHRRLFNSEELQKYFGEKSWYKGEIPPDDFPEGTLNEFELANVEAIKKWENSLGEDAYVLDQPGYDIHNVN